MTRPFPGGGTQVDQARTIARDLYRHLAVVDPHTAKLLADRYAEFGIAWLTARRDLTDGSGWVTREQAAAILGVSPQAVTNYSGRGIRRGGIVVKLTRYPEGYDEQEVHDFGELRDRSPAPAGEE